MGEQECVESSINPRKQYVHSFMILIYSCIFFCSSCHSLKDGLLSLARLYHLQLQVICEVDLVVLTSPEQV